LGEYHPGHFIRAILDNNFMEVVNRADNTNTRCLKLYAWFKHNEMSKRILNYDN
jgi:hypothetical protein